MHKNIWKKLKKPIFILAPMEDVTDTAFRQIIIRTGRPDLFFTEFTSADGLCSSGYDRVIKHLKLYKREKPIIAQIWGNKPKNIFKTVEIVKKIGFDGVDINMGCPERKIVGKGSCGGLIVNSQLAREIITAAKESAKGLPVSVKTRIGYDCVDTERWIGFLLEQDIPALTVHGRIVKEMSRFEANWEEIGKAVELRNKMGKETLIIGNGDVTTHQEALERVEKYKTDGIMIGRGIFHDPWIFNSQVKDHSVKERLELLREHIRLFEKIWKTDKRFEIMKKFYKVYIQGFENAGALRNEIMALKNAKETIEYIDLVLKRDY